MTSNEDCNESSTPSTLNSLHLTSTQLEQLIQKDIPAQLNEINQLQDGLENDNTMQNRYVEIIEHFIPLIEQIQEFLKSSPQSKNTEIENVLAEMNYKVAEYYIATDRLDDAEPHLLFAVDIFDKEYAVHTFCVFSVHIIYPYNYLSF